MTTSDAKDLISQRESQASNCRHPQLIHQRTPWSKRAAFLPSPERGNGDARPSISDLLIRRISNIEESRTPGSLTFAIVLPTLSCIPQEQVASVVAPSCVLIFNGSTEYFTVRHADASRLDKMLALTFTARPAAASRGYTGIPWRTTGTTSRSSPEHHRNNGSPEHSAPPSIEGTRSAAYGCTVLQSAVPTASLNAWISFP